MLLLREGVPVYIVARRLGHRDPSVTLNTHADAVPNDDNRVAETFTRTVWGALTLRLVGRVLAS